jgi:aspartyl-tRNA(Asn)/glutamyl-tRNA(Gln) amidotransferase subunit C
MAAPKAGDPRADSPKGGDPQAGDHSAGDHRLTRDDAAYVARLARIDLTDDELDLYAVQLAAVIGHAAEIAALDTDGVEPTAHPLPLRNVTRTDVQRPCLDRAEVLAQAPAVEDGRFRVPPILGEVP